MVGVQNQHLFFDLNPTSSTLSCVLVLKQPTWQQFHRTENPLETSAGRQKKTHRAEPLGRHVFWYIKLLHSGIN